MEKGIFVVASFVIIGIIILGFTLFTFSNKNMTDNNQTNALDKFSMEEIAKHDNAQSCWLLIDNKVYDVTQFIPNHPGGAEILKGCGKDATELFNTKAGRGIPHSGSAHQEMKDYYIGDLQS